MTYQGLLRSSTCSNRLFWTWASVLGNVERRYLTSKYPSWSSSSPLSPASCGQGHFPNGLLTPQNVHTLTSSKSPTRTPTTVITIHKSVVTLIMTKNGITLTLQWPSIPRSPPMYSLPTKQPNLTGCSIPLVMMVVPLTGNRNCHRSHSSMVNY